MNPLVIIAIVIGSVSIIASFFQLVGNFKIDINSFKKIISKTNFKLKLNETFKLLIIIIADLALILLINYIIYFAYTKLEGLSELTSSNIAILYVFKIIFFIVIISTGVINLIVDVLRFLHEAKEKKSTANIE